MIETKALTEPPRRHLDCVQRFINVHHLVIEGRPIPKQLLAKDDFSSLRQHSTPATTHPYTHSPLTHSSCIPIAESICGITQRGGQAKYVLYSPIAHDACREDRRTRKTNARWAIPEWGKRPLVAGGEIIARSLDVMTISIFDWAVVNSAVSVSSSDLK